MNTVFISQKIGKEKLNTLTNNIIYGDSHYSWKIIGDLYRKSIHELGLNTIEIVRPEIFKTEISKNTLIKNKINLHMAVKPIEELRKLPILKNIYVCGWEFEELSNSDYGVNPFFNQLRILKEADLIACWTEYTKINLQRYSLDNIIVMPPPVKLINQNQTRKYIPKIPSVKLNSNFNLSLHGLGFLSDNIPKGALIFVSVLNPFDKRKSFSSMLKGFLDAVDAGVDAYLVIKIIIDNKSTYIWNINEIIKLHYNLILNSNRILFVGDYLTDVAMENLIYMADFYLCTSSAEGLNIPLITAMQLGKPIISTWCTAMQSYLTINCSIEILTDREVMSKGGHYLDDYLKVYHYPPLVKSIYEAIYQASKLTEYDKTLMGNNAKLTAEKLFGTVKFRDNFSKAINILR